MIERDRLHQICNEALKEKGLSTDERYIKRLKKDLKSIDEQGEHEYFLNLHAKFKAERLCFPYNEHNNLVDYLLGLTKVFDIEQGFAFIQGESPDIDIDYLKDVRDYLKRDWAPKEFGQENICEISTYGASGIKSSILDMARLHSLPKEEIQSITVKIKDKFQDDEGKTQDLEWESALDLYPEFKSYCDKYPEVAKAAELLLDRNRSHGIHAGGLVICDRRIDGFVPLEIRSVNKDNPNGVIVAAWSEGLHAQDLQPVGLIKFDLLVINNLLQIALACKLIKERRGISSICALPGLWDWSDTSYLNDSKALEMANKGDLKCIFQFDSEGMRKLIKRGGVSNFDDLAAYSALYRPGPLGKGMDQTYTRRKKGEEPFNIHPVMEPFLKKTYGVMVYQENVMDILRHVGHIPDMHTEKVRKAISKKKEKDFKKYKEMFIDNGQKVLNVNADFVLNFWDQIASFAEYGFNRSVLKGTLIPTRTYGEIKLKKIESFVPGDKVFCVNEEGCTVETNVVALHDHGVLPAYEVMFDDGYTITCTMNHKFLTQSGQIPLWKIIETNSFVLCDSQTKELVYGQDRRMERSLRRGIANEEGDVASRQRMCRMSGEIIHNWRLGGSLWHEMQEQVSVVEAPITVRGVPQVGVENRRGGWKSCDCSTQSEVRAGIGNISIEGRSSETLRLLYEDKGREYSTKKHEAQSVQITTAGIIAGGSIGVIMTRNTSCESREIKGVAGGQSRGVRKMFGSDVAISKKIQNGSLAKTTVGMGHGESAMWGETETSGLCERQDMDRSGRVLPFQRESAFRQADDFGRGSSKGCDAERGDEQAWERNVNSSEHGMFCKFDRGDEAGMVGVLSEHAEITDTRRLVSRKIVRVVPVGKRQMYDLEVASSTHNFCLPNGVVTSNSHAVAYGFISARLLWLKTHYPLEFYTAILMCEDEDEKLKDYKLDAQNHGIRVNPVDINRSKANFSIDGNNIYFGFSSIKDMGQKSNKVEEHQPYAGYVDFLNRFGTDATPVKALTALGVFKEEQHDRVTLRKFSEWFKKQIHARKDRKKRFEGSMDKVLQELKDLILQEVKEDDPEFAKLCDFTEEARALWEKRFAGIMREVPYRYKGEDRIRNVTFVKLLENVMGKREKSLRNFYEKEKNDEETPLSIDQFNPDSIELDPEEEDILLDELLLNGVKTFPKAESKYYGFQWTHHLETSPDYTGATIDKFMKEVEESGLSCGPVEVVIRQVQKRTSKGERATEFYSITIEDSNTKTMKVNMWKDDWERFKDDLKVGTMVKMRVRPPSGGFNTMTFESVPRDKKKYLPAKEDDARLLIMRQPVPVETPKQREKILDDLQFDPSAIHGLEDLK